MHRATQHERLPRPPSQGWAKHPYAPYPSKHPPRVSFLRKQESIFIISGTTRRVARTSVACPCGSESRRYDTSGNPPPVVNIPTIPANKKPRRRVRNGKRPAGHSSNNGTNQHLYYTATREFIQSLTGNPPHPPSLSRCQHQRQQQQHFQTRLPARRVKPLIQ